jgi:hypothetical protein
MPSRWRSRINDRSNSAKLPSILNMSLDSAPPFVIPFVVPAVVSAEGQILFEELDSNPALIQVSDQLATFDACWASVSNAHFAEASVQAISPSSTKVTSPSHPAHRPNHHFAPE